jgi:hypothetical protein
LRAQRWCIWAAWKSLPKHQQGLDNKRRALTLAHFKFTPTKGIHDLDHHP